MGFISIQSTVAWLPWILALLTPAARRTESRFCPLAACPGDVPAGGRADCLVLLSCGCLERLLVASASS
jgi:hypothetical protein